MADTHPGAKLSKEQAIRLANSAGRGWKRKHERIRHDRSHFFNEDSAAPVLDAPLESIDYQTDLPRRIHVELKNRLTENQAVARVAPMEDTVAAQRDADTFEEVLNAGLAIVEERLGYRLQDGLADGQIVDGIAWLHWRKMEEVWPEIPDYEWLDEIPDEPDKDDPDFEKKKRQRERFEDKRRNERGELDDNGRFREKPESLRERDKRAKARAGFPIYVEIPDPLSVTARWDMNGLALVRVVKTVPLLDYDDELRENDKKHIALSQDNPKLRIYALTDQHKPQQQDALGGRKGDCKVMTLWTRDEWYEFVSDADTPTDADLETDDWELVKSGTHGWGRVPFAKCDALRFLHGEPAEQFQPALEGVFRRKPIVDRAVALLHGIAERTALPDLYLVRTDQGVALTDENGEPKYFSRDAAEAMVLDGYTIEQVDIQMNPALVESVRLLLEEYEQAAPSTGLAEISTGTQPWTARLAQQQASVQPKDLVQSQALCIREMLRSWAEMMSKSPEDGGFSSPVWVFKLDEDGRRTTEVIGVEPEAVRSLLIDVDIDATSSSEQITLTQHGVDLLKEGRITELDFIENFQGKPNATDYLSELRADRLFRTLVEPGRGAQLVSEAFGPVVVIGADGQAIDSKGMPVAPGDVLTGAGAQPAPMPQQTMGPLVDQPPPSPNTGGPAVVPQAPIGAV